MEMYSIALVAPADIDRQVLKWKTWMKEKFDCSVAFKSPAHITLVPPFWMPSELEYDLEASLNVFSALRSSFTIRLMDFSHFKPRVIFVNVVPDGRLTRLHIELNAFLLQENKYPLEKEERSFHPHVTIATRDLHKKAFYEAWEHFNEKKYQAEWPLSAISLMKHDKKKWDVINTSHFKKT
jgi:2'-5' RNA ligase